MKSKNIKKQIDYPEHAKLKSKSSEHNTVQEFIDFIQNSQRVVLHKLPPQNDEYGDEHFNSLTAQEISNLIAEFLGIDLDTFNREKEQMYNAYLEGMNVEPPAKTGV